MIQIVYVSAACEPFSANALSTLLRNARARNQMYEVTGMLLYHDRSFLQVLEGDAKYVDATFERIGKDPRHRNTRVLHRGPIHSREFPDWSMAFIDTSAWPLQTKGFVNYNRSRTNLPGMPSAASRYLNMFQEGLYRQA